MIAKPNHFGDQSKESVAKRLADAHRATDPTIQHIFRIEAPDREDDPREPIKLLEVTSLTSVSGIVPVSMGAHAPSGIFYPSTVVEIHPSEYEQLRGGYLALPHGWTFRPDQEL